MEGLREDLIADEGIRLKPYLCPAGKTTIGVGRNLDDVGITEAEAMITTSPELRRSSLMPFPGYKATTSSAPWVI